MHLLFGDAPYLYTALGRWTGGPSWHKRWCRSEEELRGHEKVLLFCGLKPVSELVTGAALGITSIAELAVTRRRDLSTCALCLAALDAYLELGRAALKPERSWAGDLRAVHVRLLFKPSGTAIASVINRVDPLTWDWAGAARPKKQRPPEPEETFEVRRVPTPARPHVGASRYTPLQRQGELFRTA